MPLRMFRSTRPLKNLSTNVKKNIDLYRTGNFSDFLTDKNYFIIDETFQNKDLDELIHGQNSSHDLENSLLVWNKLKITPRIFREARFWTVLTHGICLDYVRSRWPLGENIEKNIKQIKTHYLVPGAPRGLERDNALSRLWMSAYVASKVKSLKLEEALKILVFQTDFREGIVGRPTVLKSHRVLDAVMTTAKRILYDEDDKNFFRRKNNDGPYKRWLVELNLEGSTRLLDAFSESDLKKLVDDLADSQRV